MKKAFLVAAVVISSAISAHAWSPELEAHFKAQRTGICELHHIRMTRVLINVSYGLPMYDNAYVAAQGRYFPNGEATASGGCDPSPGPRKVTVYVCPECKRARRQWALKHPKNWQAKLVLEES